MDEKLPPGQLAPSVAKGASTSRRVLLFVAETFPFSLT